MAFPSPAENYAERSLSLDRMTNLKPIATFYMRASEDCLSVGIRKGSVLVIDRSLTPQHGSLLVTTVNDEFSVKRYVEMPVLGLQRLDNTGFITPLSDFAEEFGGGSPIWGVIAYVLTDVADLGFNSSLFD